MAKVYILKESDFKALVERLALEKFRSQEFVPQSEKFDIGEVHRSFHYHVVSWINEMKEPEK